MNFFKMPPCQMRLFVLNSTILFGAIAQLGERLHGMQEVVSSNLIGSIFVSYAETKTYNTCLATQRGRNPP